MHSFMASHHKIFHGCSVSRTRLLKSSLQLGVVNMSPHSWKTFIGSLSSKGSSLSYLFTSTSVYTIKVRDISLTIFISTHQAGLDCDHLQTQPCSPFLNHQNWWLATDLSIWLDLDCGIQFLQQSGKQPPSRSSRDGWKHISSVKLTSGVHVPIQAYTFVNTLCAQFLLSYLVLIPSNTQLPRLVISLAR